MILTNILRILLTKSFKPFVFDSNYENKMDFKNLQNLGLYVHIPFCKSICDFCPYCKVKYNKCTAVAYKEALLKEIDLACKNMSKKKIATSLYFGGGTPALMIDELHEIIQKINEHFIIQEGIGVELHPSNINDEVLRKLKSQGVTMISVGIQSFNKGCLRKLGRDYDSFKEKLQLVHQYGFEVIDADLIFGIPGQDKEILKNDIITAFESGATQISTYPFIDFTFANNKYKPLSHKQKKKMLKYLNNVCEDLGVDRTSVWTFAKKNTDKYSSITRDTFLGFGVSATTLLKDSFKINTFSIEQYIKRVDGNNLPTSLTLNFTKRQRAVYYLFWSAYSLKISKSNFEDIIGIPMDKMFGKWFWLAGKFGIIIDEGDYYYLTEKAAIIYHYIEQIYTTQYIDKMWNISREIAFPEEIILK